MNTSFWNGKKVLITGHTGFKGSWLSLWLQNLGANVVGCSLKPPTEPNLYTLAAVEHNMTSVIVDIRDHQAVLHVFLQHQPEIVFHLAAQSLVRYGYQAPIETYATNVMGTVHVLEAARLCGSVRSIINVTTDKCYDNKEWCWGYRETDALGGFDPYSSSKASAELVTSSYRRSFFDESSIGLASVRAGNVLGGGDWAEARLIPDVIRAFIKQEPLVVRNPTAIRPWQHVLEPLSGYLMLAEQLYQSQAFADAWNFGPDEGDAQSVQWILDYIASRWPGAAKSVLASSPQVHEAQYLKLDCAKAKSVLGWVPRWDLKRGLEETIHWYQAYLNGASMHQQTLAQIESFCADHNESWSIEK